MEIEPGDIIADKQYGHVLKVYRVELPLVWAVIECNPSCFLRFDVSEIRLLSKTKGVDMSHWNSAEFSDSIKRQLEWAKGVHGLPKKYKATTKRHTSPKAPSLQLDGMSLEQLEELLVKMEKK